MKNIALILVGLLFIEVTLRYTKHFYKMFYINSRLVLNDLFHIAYVLPVVSGRLLDIYIAKLSNKYIMRCFAPYEIKYSVFKLNLQSC